MKQNVLLKSIILVAVFFTFHLSPFTLQAQVNWHTISDAAQAKIGSRLYIVDFYTDWCGYCKKMDRQTFTDPTVAKIMNTYYYPVKFNAEGGETVRWNGRVYPPAAEGRNKVHVFAQSTLGSRIGFPSFAIFRADGTLLTVIPGFYPPKDFTAVLWYFASGDNAKYSYDKYMQIFDKEIRPEMEKALK